MIRRWTILAAVLALWLGAALGGEDPGASAVADLVERVAPSVVYIEGEDGSGSGFVVKTEPFIDICTNHHVIKGCTSFAVCFFLKNDRTGTAEKFEVLNVRPYFAFPRLDFAYLRLDNTDPKVQEMKKRVKPLPLGDSHKIRVGERVMVIGSPGAGMVSLGNSVSDGLLSGKNRYYKGLPYFQTSAPVNFGNSGGPLLNMRGEVVGVVTAKVPMAENIAFALPIHMTDGQNYKFYMPEEPAKGAAELMDRGRTLLGQKKAEEAAAVYREAQAKGADKAAPVVREALAQGMKGDSDRLIALCEKALAMEQIRYDDWKLAVLELGRAYGRKGDHQKALDTLVTALDRDATDADLNRLVGTCYANMGRKSKALAHWQISLWIEPEQPELERNIRKMIQAR